MATQCLVRACDLRRWFGDAVALDGVSFEVSRGDVLGFLGPNGAGKSTTMRILCGVLAPSEGRVEIAGVDLLSDPVGAKRHLGYLPEHPPLYPELTVEEYLRYCATLRAVPRRQRPAAIERALESCGLEQVARRPLGSLSKGFGQRAGIAQAVIHDPAVVVLDEPTVGLDPNQIREIRALVRELGRTRAVILSTHLLGEVQSVCNRVQLLHRGRLRLSSSLADLGAQPERTLRVRLAHPPGPEPLAALPGVVDAQVVASDTYRLVHEGDPALAEHVAGAAVAAGWGLRELTPETGSLEEIFAALTRDEPAPDPGEQAA